MTDAQAALARWRQHREAPDVTKSPYYKDWMECPNQPYSQQFIRDLVAIADDVLAEHDETPITEDVLDRIGFADPTGQWIDCHLSVDGVVITLERYANGEWLLNYNHKFDWPHDLRTVWQLKRTLSALGIEVKG